MSHAVISVAGHTVAVTGPDAEGLAKRIQTLLGYVEPEDEQPDKGDSRLLRYGYAPGNYMGRCRKCGFMSYAIDKRAICCRQCAETLANLADAQTGVATEERGGGLPWTVKCSDGKTRLLYPFKEPENG